MSVHRPSRPTAMPSPTGRFSLEEDCDRTNPISPFSSPSQFISSSASHRIVIPASAEAAKHRNNNIDCHSSSAPSSFSATYNPFSSTSDYNTRRVNGGTTTPGSKREGLLSKNHNLKQQPQRWADGAATLLERQQQHQQHQQHQQQQQQQQQSHRPPQESDLPPVQEESLPQQQQQQQHPHLSTTTETTTALAPNDDNQEAPIASPSQSGLHPAIKTVQATMGLANHSSSATTCSSTTSFLHTTTAFTASTADTASTPITTNSNQSFNSAMRTPPTRIKSTKDRATERDQRRHSSEDGRSCTTSTTSSSSSNHRPSSSPPASLDKYAIPPKCRMVFHMRDEVPRPREEDKTGLSENRFYQYRPQPQPRGRIHAQSPSSSSSSSADKSQDEGSLLWTPTSPLPVKKSKCAKMVTFKEPEPWRDVTPPPPHSSFAAQNEKKEDRQEGKQIRMLFTRLDIPTITVTEPNQEKQQQQMREISSSALTPTVRRPISEPILSNGSTVLSSSFSSSSHRHAQAVARERASTPPPKLTSSSDQQQPLSSTMGGRHRRNMSMPVQSTSSSFSPSPSPVTGSNVPRRMQAGQGGAMIEEPRTTTTKSGNRLLRLWRSATQKYSSHHNHNHSGHYPHGPANGVGFLGGKGSDLEPLVSMARE